MAAGAIGNGSSLVSELGSLTLQQRKQPTAQQTKRTKMSGSLKVTRRALLMEIRHGTFEVLVNRKRVGSSELHGTFGAPVPSGRHTLEVRKGRYSSRQLSFLVTDGRVVGFNRHGRRITHSFSPHSSFQAWRSSPLGRSADANQPPPAYRPCPRRCRHRWMLWGLLGHR